ncbi:type IX secretion system protein PorG [Costertonia aggregata]|uniref:DUF6089 domain-containing protein n=1 Tax=Costertonia aggregata TaxID=343403 RepID=A0A7H9AM15_9FLAO|nr:DUF6089 family protein [Costertonia aggregata]QLG44489.1 hypothetical protein HYG79_03715 [Costertonia aggregata]
MRIFFVVALLFFFASGEAQTYEIGGFVGGANNIGDIGRTNFILPSGPAFGGLFKWNKSKRYAWRAHVIYGTFTADDSKSGLPSRQQRGFRIKNSVLEASAGLEFNFVEYNLHKLGPAFTPYLYTGLTYFRYDFKYFDAAQLQEIPGNQRDGSFAIPMTVGFKARISQALILGGEIGARYTFTDNLDASNPEGSNFEQFRFGNIFSDDWYVFSGITLTYTFGRKPCMDCFE